jgi:exodeoxyribonuclease VII large subunit
MSAQAGESRVRHAIAGAALEAAGRARLDEARSRLVVAAASLDALSPLAVLGRGYALAADERGRLLRSSKEARVGGRVSVRLSEGALRCVVEGVEGTGGKV